MCVCFLYIDTHTCTHTYVYILFDQPFKQIKIKLIKNEIFELNGSGDRDHARESVNVGPVHEKPNK